MENNMTNAIIFDTETTDLERREIIQAAWMPVDESLEMGSVQDAMFKPAGPINFGATAIHHILIEDLEGCPSSSDFSLAEGVEYIIGHNIDFDWVAAGKPDVRRICTLALSRKIWPDTDSHTLVAMIYMLYGGKYRSLIKSAHDAGADVLLNKHLLQSIVDKLFPDGGLTFETLWQESEKARVPDVMPFGKHKGQPIKSVPHSYKRWLLGQADVDPYLAKALRGPK